MPLPAEYLRCLPCQKQIISQQAVEKMVYRGQCLHRLGKTGVDWVTRLLRTIPQLPDTKVPKIFPENTNTEPLPIVGWLCLGGEWQWFMFRTDSKIDLQFLCSGVGR